MPDTIVSADGRRVILPNGYSRQLPHGAQGCITWCFDPEGKIWPKCDGCQVTYTITDSGCDYCKEPDKVANMPGWSAVIPVGEKPL